MKRTSISKREFEELLTARMNERYPGFGKVGIIPGPGGWRCHVQRLVSSASSLNDARRILADIAGRYVVVDEDGHELDGTFFATFSDEVQNFCSHPAKALTHPAIGPPVP
jgi:hypothetical protein